jgi:hypothetical protein
VGTHPATLSLRASAGSAVIERTFNIAVEVRASGLPQVSPENLVVPVRPGTFARQYTITNPGAAGLSYLVTAASYTLPYEYRSCTGAGTERACTWTPQVRTLPSAVTSIDNSSGTVPAGGIATVTVRGTAGASAAANLLHFRVGPGSLLRSLYIVPAVNVEAKGLQAASCSASDVAVVFRNLTEQSSLTAGLPAAIEAQIIDGCGQAQTGGRLTAASFDAAETAARAEIEAIGADFDRGNWSRAYASSGTALALVEILEQNGLSAGGITPDGLARLRRRMISVGHVSRLRLVALKQERAPVLAGGFAIMAAALAQLKADRIDPVGGALRLGVLYDLLGRSVERDARDLTVDHFIARYRLDRDHAQRVARMAVELFLRACPKAARASAQELERAALLHETGFSVSHTGFHKHGAYILRNADMPGFSAGEQERLSWLVLGCRGRLDKVAPSLGGADFRAQLCALRLAVLFHHARRAIPLPRLALSIDHRIRLRVPARWLAAHPLTAHLLEQEAREWKSVGYGWSKAA